MKFSGVLYKTNLAASTRYPTEKIYVCKQPIHRFCQLQSLNLSIAWQVRKVGVSQNKILASFQMLLTTVCSIAFQNYLAPDMLLKTL